MSDEKKPERKTKDLHLHEPYEELHAETVYSDDKRVGKIFGVRDKQTNEKFIRLLSESYKYDRKAAEMAWKNNYGFNLYECSHVERVISFLKKIAGKIGWKPAPGADVEALQQEIRRQAEQLAEARASQDKMKQEHEETLAKYAQKVEELGKSRLPSFKSDIEALEKMLSEARESKVPEADLQEFLYAHSWFFGLEYITSVPQLMRGAYSRFDFYLERFNKTNDIVEIKLISDSIVNSDGSISAKVIQAVDQVIQYMESAAAAAHSTVISEEEGIKELRPRGTIIIGSDGSAAAVKKLHQWNYQMAHIRILTYDDILKQGKTIVSNIEVKP